MNIENWPISKPVPYARNARKIPQKAIDKVAASIQEFSFRQPIVVDEKGVIIAGHTRLLAAQKLGLEQVPVHVATGLTEGQVKAYRLMDNRSHEEAEWDVELIAAELCDLQAFAVDPSLTGFDASELKNLMEQEPKAGLTDEDAAPEPQENPTTVRGDVWLLGDHRVMCGDAVQGDDIERLMAGGADCRLEEPANFNVLTENVGDGIAVLLLGEPSHADNARRGGEGGQECQKQDLQANHGWNPTRQYNIGCDWGGGNAGACLARSQTSSR